MSDCTGGSNPFLSASSKLLTWLTAYYWRNGDIFFYLAKQHFFIRRGVFYVASQPGPQKEKGLPSVPIIGNDDDAFTDVVLFF